MLSDKKRYFSIVFSVRKVKENSIERCQYIKNNFDIVSNKIYNAARMVNKSDSKNDITEEDEFESEEVELEDIEEQVEDRTKKLRQKLKLCEEEKRNILDESQRTKADFLNARKRLEEERAKDRIRYKKEHIEQLLPVCDSFTMAMKDEAVWNKADESWRKGIEGIYNQLQKLLASYNVTLVNPDVHEEFNPELHEAIQAEEVTEKKLDGTIVTVVQPGYVIQSNDTTEVVRPARVITGTFTES